MKQPSRLVAEVEQLEEITIKEFLIESKKNINLIALEEATDPEILVQ